MTLVCSLQNNDLNAEAAKHLSHDLKANKGLASLDLRDNNLTNGGEDMSGIIHLAEALKTNEGLTSLKYATCLATNYQAGVSSP